MDNKDNLKLKYMNNGGRYMNNNTQEKGLIALDEKGIIYKIKLFFKNLFNKKMPLDNDSNTYNNDTETIKNNEIEFKKYISKIEDAETMLLKLQKKYRSGQIKEEDLSSEQIDSLCKLYDSQIEKLRKSNELRKQKILKYKEKFNIN